MTEVRTNLQIGIFARLVQGPAGTVANTYHSGIYFTYINSSGVRVTEIYEAKPTTDPGPVVSAQEVTNDRIGLSSGMPSPFGAIKTSVVQYEGQDIESIMPDAKIGLLTSPNESNSAINAKADIIRGTFEQIGSANFDYRPLVRNSNTVVATALFEADIQTIPNIFGSAAYYQPWITYIPGRSWNYDTMGGLRDPSQLRQLESKIIFNFQIRPSLPGIEFRIPLREQAGLPNDITPVNLTSEPTENGLVRTTFEASSEQGTIRATLTVDPETGRVQQLTSDNTAGGGWSIEDPRGTKIQFAVGMISIPNDGQDPSPIIAIPSANGDSPRTIALNAATGGVAIVAGVNTFHLLPGGVVSVDPNGAISAIETKDNKITQININGQAALIESVDPAGGTTRVEIDHSPSNPSVQEKIEVNGVTYSVKVAPTAQPNSLGGQITFGLSTQTPENENSEFPTEVQTGPSDPPPDARRRPGQRCGLLRSAAAGGEIDQRSNDSAGQLARQLELLGFPENWNA